MTINQTNLISPPHFKILNIIAKGGMGTVYRAVEEALNRTVALKVIQRDKHNGNDNAIERFFKEAELLATISHPAIVSIYRLGEWEQGYYISMEYVEGQPLDALIKQGNIPENQVLYIALQVSEGLQAVYRKNIIHRDIKPSNILITAGGNVKILDFGIAKKLDDASNLTHVGLVLGTPHYMSPEQAEGQPLDFRSDIYSLGVTLYHALTGRHLWKGYAVADIIFQHKYGQVTPPSCFTSVSQNMEKILDRMLLKKREDRYKDYEGLIYDLKAALDGRKVKYAEIGPKVSVYKCTSRQKQKPLMKRIKAFFQTLVPAAESSGEIVLISNYPTSILKTWENFNYNLDLKVLQQRDLDDLTAYLSHVLANSNKTLVICDLKFLGCHALKLSDFLKKHFDQVRIVFAIPDVEKLEEPFLCTYSSQMGEEMVKKLGQLWQSRQETVREFTLKDCLHIVTSAGLSVEITIETRSDQKGKLIFYEGNLQYVDHDENTSMERAFSMLLLTYKTWYISLTETVKIFDTPPPMLQNLLGLQVGENKLIDTQKHPKTPYPDETSLSPQTTPMKEPQQEMTSARNDTPVAVHRDLPNQVSPSSIAVSDLLAEDYTPPSNMSFGQASAASPILESELLVADYTPPADTALAPEAISTPISPPELSAPDYVSSADPLLQAPEPLRAPEALPAYEQILEELPAYEQVLEELQDVHLLIGLGIWSMAAQRIVKEFYRIEEQDLRVDLCKQMYFQLNKQYSNVFGEIREFLIETSKGYFYYIFTPKYGYWFIGLGHPNRGLIKHLLTPIYDFSKVT